MDNSSSELIPTLMIYSYFNDPWCFTLTIECATTTIFTSFT